jgi:hypothetical protein
MLEMFFRKAIIYSVGYLITISFTITKKKYACKNRPINDSIAIPGGSFLVPLKIMEVDDIYAKLNDYDINRENTFPDIRYLQDIE